MSSLAALVATSQRVAATRGRREKIGHLAELLRGLDPDQIEIDARAAGAGRERARALGST
jgi:hypothetical protein